MAYYLKTISVALYRTHTAVNHSAFLLPFLLHRSLTQSTGGSSLVCLHVVIVGFEHLILVNVCPADCRQFCPRCARI